MTDTQGKFLVAPPNMPDWRFQKSVVYIWKHDVTGACGVIVNKKCNHPDFKHVCQEGKVTMNKDVNSPVYYGGPMLNNLIGVLHTTDFMLISTNHFTKQNIAFTLDRKILEAIAQGGGPKTKMITMGIAQWASGQLEDELEMANGRPQTASWLVLDYDPKIVFGPQPVDIWEMCVSRAVENKTKEITNKIFKDLKD